MRAPIDVQIDAEHLGGPGVQRHETRKEAQQRALAGAVPARHEHHLALVHIEVDAGERREAIEEADGGAKTDDGLHRASLE